MNNSEIQIQFPRPGQWDEFTLTAVYQDKGGYRPPARYTQDEIPTDHAPATQAALVAADDDESRFDWRSPPPDLRRA